MTSKFRVVVVAIGVAAAAVTTAVPASADDGNDAFLDALNKAGVQYGDPNAAAELGKKICPMLAKPAGTSPRRPRPSAARVYISPAMTGLFTTIAIRAYCPTMINQMANGDFSGIGSLAGLGNFAGLPQIPGMSGGPGF